ncbi:MAG: tetratricopeptide repeat protein [Deltaproteobacteria bacterium]|nr:tetratricopeptide repeat protein [Deltaproteobacteria bacterium]
MTTDTRPKRSNPAIVGAFVILCVCFATYATTLQRPFFFDDIPFIVGETTQRDLANIGSFFIADQHLLYRPVRSVAYTLMHAGFGLDPVPYRVVAIALHALCCILIAAIAIESGLGAGAALLAGLVFALHPVHADRVANTTAAFDLVGLALGYAGLFGLIRYARYGSRRAWGFGALALAAGLLGSEECVTIFALFLAWWWTVGRDAPGRHVSLAAIVAFVVTVGYLVARTLVLGQIARTGIAPVPGIFERLSAGAIAWWYGALKIAFPFSLRPAYGFTVESAPHALLFAAIPAWAILMRAIWRGRERRGLPAFAILWAVVAFAPFAQIIPTDTVMAERYFYSPLAGAALLAGWAYDRGRHDVASPARTLANILVVTGLVAMALASAHRGYVWADESRLWADAYSKDDRAAITVLNHANALKDAGRPDDACELYPRAIALDPFRHEPLVGFGDCLVRRGDVEGAIEVYQKANEMAPGARGPLEGLCQALAMSDRFDPAAECARRLVEIDPDSLVGPYVLGYSAWRQGRLEDARNALEAAARSPRGPKKTANAAVELLARINLDRTP